MKSFLTLSIAVFLVMSQGVADSLLSHNAAKQGTFVSEKITRFSPGDIISILISEKIDASTSADINTKKESDIESKGDAGENSFFVNGLGLVDADTLPNWAIESENETKNTGKTSRKSDLTTTVSCFVSQVLPNGNLLLEGQKQVTVNREASTVVVSGVVRSRDVSPENTITSAKVANLAVQLRGKGPLWNNQRQGFLTRMLNWFSPN
jgi:flagellar L-ring protein precursor FlgH